MNLDEFRSALSSEATKQNETMKTEIEELRKKTAAQASKIRELEGLVKESSEDIHVLQNRCAVTTHFTLCGMCGMKFRCRTLMEAISRTTNQGGIQ